MIRFILLAIVFIMAVAVIWCWSVAGALSYNDEWWTPPGPDDPPPTIVIWERK